MRKAEEISWAGGTHSFRLDIGALRTIEQQSDAGVAVVLQRLLAGTWKIDDIFTTLRVGLIGGGMTDVAARRTVSNALDSHSPYALSIVAADVLRRFIMWDEEDAPDQPPGEPEAGTEETEPRD